MSRDSASRIDVGLSSLISALLQSEEGEDLHDLKQRQSEALDLARSILEEYRDDYDDQAIQTIGDSLQQKFWREQDAPDKAIQFGNLFSRLLTLPILNRKKEIVLLLQHLSNPPSTSHSSSLAHSPPPTTIAPARYPQDRHELPKSVVPVASTRDGSGLKATSKFPEPEIDYVAQDPFSMADRPTEAYLLRDLPFTLQGLSSNNFHFDTKSSILLPPTLPLPLISLLHTLAEPSLLYRNLFEWTQSKDEGLISQSLRAAIGLELRSYLGLIATLEGEIRRSLSDTAQQQDRKTIVTLKRCVVWTRDATLGLRLMSLMSEESRTKKGGQLISLIHSFATSYGDPFVSSFAERLLVHLTKPFYNMLRQWIYDGELLDPYHEFFVIEQAEETNPRSASNVWENKYKLDAPLVPSIITDEFAKKVFLIGKSLNFIRYSCSDSAWVEEYSKNTSKELSYGDTNHLEASIDEAYKTTMSRLTHLMADKFKLFDHLDALKKYLLLGQGDFVALLMESLSTHLDRPAGSQYRHTLTAQLDHAIRGSNAQFDSPDVLRRLDARLLEMSHGEIGWDVFTLEYKVDPPVDVIITPWANKQYLAVFNFLWRIKRVEFALGSTWRRLMTGARGILSSVSEKLGGDWKTARCSIAEMTHFINQLQYYILSEVIEASWEQLQESIRKDNCTLDDMITAHTQFLKSITQKGLLGASRSSASASREESLMHQLHYILKTMLAYRDSVDGLYSFSVAESFRQHDYANQRGSKAARAPLERMNLDSEAESPGFTDKHYKQKLTNRGSERDTDSPIPGAAALAGIGASTGLDTDDDDQMLEALRKRLSELSNEFRTRLATLLGDLLARPDPDLKFLGVAMNFNDVYKPVIRRKKKKEGEGASKAQTGHVHV